MPTPRCSEGVRAMARKPASDDDYGRQLTVPLDASGIEGFKPEQPVKVLIADRNGPLQSQSVKLDAKGQGVARFAMPQAAGGVRVIVGPGDATDEELIGLQTLTVSVPATRLRESLTIPAIRILPYWWWWWLRWCRTFVIRGRVLCPDGSPVAGAMVCAYDVDWWFWFSSTQQIACAPTDINGVFEMKFRWCCGWWPWWWWSLRYWRLEPLLVERILPVLQREPGLASRIQPTAQPRLEQLTGLLGAEGARFAMGKELDPSILPALGDRLRAKLPFEAELERLHIWPWWPWLPGWADCNPDVIFKVTQECAAKAGGSDVILEETIWDTRVNVPTALDVVLVAGDNACCIGDDGCLAGECLAFTEACGANTDTIGGNPTAPASPDGYQNPGGLGTYSDRPFAGRVTIEGTAACIEGVAYYEFLVSTSLAGPYADMNPAANGTIQRSYIEFPSGAPPPPPPPFTWTYPSFPATPISGRNVYETLQHYEDTHPPANWGIFRHWVDARDVLIEWGSQHYPDGTYYLKIQGWDVDAGGNLVNPRILKVCESDDDAYIVLTVNNRVETPGPNDLHGNPCTAVHVCTNEPDTALVAIEVHRGPTTITLEGCAFETLQDDDELTIDFIAHDPDGHLAEFTLDVHFDVNLVTDLIPLGTLGPSPTPLLGVAPAAQAEQNYAAAVAAGATRPTWEGGAFRLTLTGAGLKAAFPYPCCYLMQLEAWKRNIVSCSTHFRNASETSFTFG